MKRIITITDDPKQSMTIILDDGTRVFLSLMYKQNQSAWFYDLTYGTAFNFYGRRLVVSSNILRSFRDLIPFGIACMTKDTNDPTKLDDFSAERAKLYILNQADVEEVENLILNG